ncbi:peptidyl-trna hydrolase domain-containing protein [Botrytis cinerea]
MRYFAKLTAKLLQSPSQIVKPIDTTSLQTRPLFTRLHFQGCRTYSVQSTDEIEFEVARTWYSNFNESTISTKLAETTYSAAGGPGGQKTNKTSSKANTVWPMKKLDAILPLTISNGLRRGTYYLKNTDAIQIQCDSSRNRTDNKEETHRRLHEEIRRIYRTTVPGKASIEQQQRVKHL